TRSTRDWSSDVCSSDLRGANARERLLECGVLLVGRQNFQTLHQRKAGIDHHRELPEEDGNLLHLDLAGPEGGQSELFAFFANGRSEERRVGKAVGWEGV